MTLQQLEIAQELSGETDDALDGVAPYVRNLILSCLYQPQLTSCFVLMVRLSALLRAVTLIVRVIEGFDRVSWEGLSVHPSPASGLHQCSCASITAAAVSHHFCSPLSSLLFSSSSCSSSLSFPPSSPPLPFFSGSPPSSVSSSTHSPLLYSY